MGAQRFTAEFKEEAVRQVVGRGYPVAQFAIRVMYMRLLRCVEYCGLRAQGSMSGYISRSPTGHSKTVGWSMKRTPARKLVLDALLTSSWRRQPRTS
jgi:hypothetical protein